MPTTKPNNYLISNYNKVSDFCHSRKKPMFITNNDQKDLVIMSIDVYEELYSRYELYHLIDESLEEEKNGDFMSFDDFMTDFRTEII